MQKFLIVSLFGLTALIGFSTRVVAEGALAIGSTGNVVADGVAIGGSVSDPTREGAIAAALREVSFATRRPESSGAMRRSCGRSRGSVMRQHLILSPAHPAQAGG